VQVYSRRKIDQRTRPQQPEKYSDYKSPEQWHHPVKKPEIALHNGKTFCAV
jgi:hypothetical protein